MPLTHLTAARRRRRDDSGPVSPNRHAMNTTKRLVIIEDDTGTRTLLRNAAETAGWWVDHGASQSDVWAALAHADVVTLDVRLQGADGLDILRQLRRGGSTTPVIVVSGDDRPDLEAEAFAAGATRFMEKPFDVAELLDTLTDLQAAHSPGRGALAHLDAQPAPVAQKAWFMS